MNRDDIIQLLDQHRAYDHHETQDMRRLRDFLSEQPRFWRRDNMAGHVTASAWIVDSSLSEALLTHHRKLDRWLQPGGHIDDDPNMLSAALREAREESGLSAIEPFYTAIFDIDVHLIPARGAEPAHHHFDVRFLLVADRHAELAISEESKALRWFSLDDIHTMADDASLRRMVEKTHRLHTPQTG